MITDNVDVLLVEDNPYDAELTVMSLKRSGLAERVCHVKDGVEAFEYIFGTGQFEDRGIDVLPRLVLLDIKLPRIDGVEVLRRVKADERTAGVPVVALTSSREERDIAACYRLGVNSYIVKPVDFDQFSRVITRVASYWLRLNKPPY
jgi:CheY-like chemotaxis protein